MGFELDADELGEGFEELSHEVVEEATRRWNSAWQEILYESGGELDYEVQDIVRSGMPVQWDSAREGYVLGPTHPAAEFFEVGTDPHVITPTNAESLAFEWEEMRGEEFGDTGKTFEEVYDTFPLVFLPRVSVNGIVRLDYFERGMQEAASWLEGQI